MWMNSNLNDIDTKEQDRLTESVGTFYDEDYYVNKAINENTVDTGESSITDKNELLEAFFAFQVSSMPQKIRKEYLLSEEVHDLVEAGVVGRRTIVRLNKKDDLARRIKLAAYQKAKEKGDAKWKALVKLQMKKRKLVSDIMRQYSQVVKADAIRSQKNLIRISPKAFNMNVVSR